MWKLEILPFEFCLISGDWGKLGIPNLAQTSPIKCYWMLQNAGVTGFTVSELLRKNQQGYWNYPTPTPPPNRLGLARHISCKGK